MTLAAVSEVRVREYRPDRLLAAISRLDPSIAPDKIRVRLNIHSSNGLGCDYTNSITPLAVWIGNASNNVKNSEKLARNLQRIRDTMLEFRTYGRYLRDNFGRVNSDPKIVRAVMKEAMEVPGAREIHLLTVRMKRLCKAEGKLELEIFFMLAAEVAEKLYAGVPGIDAQACAANMMEYAEIGKRLMPYTETARTYDPERMLAVLARLDPTQKPEDIRMQIQVQTNGLIADYFRITMVFHLMMLAEEDINEGKRLDEVQECIARIRRAMLEHPTYEEYIRRHITGFPGAKKAESDAIKELLAVPGVAELNVISCRINGLCSQEGLINFDEFAKLYARMMEIKYGRKYENVIERITEMGRMINRHIEENQAD